MTITRASTSADRPEPPVDCFLHCGAFGISASVAIRSDRSFGTCATASNRDGCSGNGSHCWHSIRYQWVTGVLARRYLAYSLLFGVRQRSTAASPQLPRGGLQLLLTTLTTVGTLSGYVRCLIAVIAPIRARSWLCHNDAKCQSSPSSTREAVVAVPNVRRARTGRKFIGPICLAYASNDRRRRMGISRQAAFLPRQCIGCVGRLEGRSASGQSCTAARYFQSGSAELAWPFKRRAAAPWISIQKRSASRFTNCSVCPALHSCGTSGYRPDVWR